jgi:hypothetical protein
MRSSAVGPDRDAGRSSAPPDAAIRSSSESSESLGDLRCLNRASPSALLLVAARKPSTKFSSSTARKSARYSCCRSAGVLPGRSYSSWPFKQQTGRALRMGAIARPAVLARMANHPGSNGVELEVAAAGKEVGLAVDERGTRPSHSVPVRRQAPDQSTDKWGRSRGVTP